MKPFKKILLCAVLPAVIATISLSASTQHLAKHLAYQTQLGLPLVVFKGLPLYNPFKILPWYYHFQRFAPKQFEKALLFSYGGFACAVLLAIFGSRSRTKEAPTSHGSARWANQEDLKAAKLLDGKGVLLGVSKEGQYLRHDGPEHIICMAPTRSGKGVGIIIPTLLTWPHSVIVTDIKGENWGITSGFRKRGLGNKVLKFDPTATDGSSVRYNPLAEIRKGTLLEVKDTQNIADILVDPQGTGQQDHWAKTGHALLVGAILHVLYSAEIPLKNLTAIASCLSDPLKTIDQTLEEMLKAQHDPFHEYGWFDISGQPTATHPVVAAAARELMNKSENERSGVLSTAMSFLGLYRDPIVSANTATSDFHITELMNADTPVSLYLVVPPSDLSRTRPLMRMIINQTGRTLTESMEFKDGRPVQTYKHRLLLLLDEFPALGRLDFFESALAFIAGYGMKALLIVQSLNQLNKAYSADNSIMDNCHIRTVYTPNDYKTAELISKMLSQKTELVSGENYSGTRGSFFLKNVSRFTQEIARSLMTAGEILVLPFDEEIIFAAGIAPIKANKLFYFKDKNFTSRLLAAPAKSDVCRVTPATSKPPAEPEALDDLEPILDGEEEIYLEGRTPFEIAAEAAGTAATLETWGEVLKDREPDLTTVPGLNTEVQHLEDPPATTKEKDTEEKEKVLNTDRGLSL